eukprot:170156-Prymnesium_polylepis.1
MLRRGRNERRKKLGMISSPPAASMAEAIDALAPTSPAVDCRNKVATLPLRLSGRPSERPDTKEFLWHWSTRDELTRYLCGRARLGACATRARATSKLALASSHAMLYAASPQRRCPSVLHNRRGAAPTCAWNRLYQTDSAPPAGHKVH